MDARGSVFTRVRSARMKRKVEQARARSRLPTRPVARLSTPMTVCRRTRSRSVSVDPKKPAAPVTTAIAKEVGVEQAGYS
jgi:hypothetical protein